MKNILVLVRSKGDNANESAEVPTNLITGLLPPL